MRIHADVTEIRNRAFDECISLKNVYYAGTQAQWEKIKITENGNDYLLNATMHYNS